MRTLPKTLPLLVLLALLLTACQPAGGPAAFGAGTPVPAQTFTPRAGETRPGAETAQAQPSPTSAPAESPTPEPSPTATSPAVPTLNPALAQARLLGVSWQPGYNLLLTIEFSEPVRPEDVQVVIEEEEYYECQTLSEFPNRLYCLGRGREVYDRMEVQIFQTGAAAPAFESRLYVPYFNENFTESKESR